MVVAADPLEEIPVMTPLPAAREVVRGPSEAYARRSRSVVANIFLSMDLGLFGLGILGGIFSGIRILLASPSEKRDLVQGSAPLSEAAIWAVMAASFLMVGVIPFLWVLMTRLEPREGTRRYLGFTKPFGWATFVGVGLGGCCFGGVLMLLTLAELAGLLPSGGGDQPDIYGFSRFLSWELAVFTSLTAGIGEELLFRGVLYRWLGWWGQAPVFMLAHMAAGEPLQLVVTLAMGLLFGFLRRSGWSLWTLMLAHSVYDFCLLGGSLVFGG